MHYYFHNLDKQKFQDLISITERDLNETHVNDIHVFYMPNDSDQLRFELRKIINRPHSWVILVSKDKNVMDLSWKVGVEFFINADSENPNLSKLLKATISRLISKNNAALGKKIRIKSTNRIDYIDPNAISYILGDGNYSKIFHNNGETLVSKNLKSIEESLSSLSFLSRYGKSVIINTKKVKSIQGRTIGFENGKSLEFPKYGNGFKDLKNKLLWKTI